MVMIPSRPHHDTDPVKLNPDEQRSMVIIGTYVIPDIPTSIRVVILTPAGKAAKMAEHRKFGKGRTKEKSSRIA